MSHTEARPPAPALSPVVSGLVDDAAIFPPGNAAPEDAVAAFLARRGTPQAGLVASFVVSDHQLAELRDRAAEDPLPVSVVIGAGAGGIAPAAHTAKRLGDVMLQGLEVALRDPDDLPGNARRVIAGVDQARAEGWLEEETPVHVELPAGPPTAGWLAAADEVAALAEQGLRLKFRTGGVDAHLFPDATTLAAWIDAALDRETAFKCTAGLHHALRHTDHATGFEHHGFLNVLVATRACFDGADREEVAAVLEERAADPLFARWQEWGDDLVAGTRRWFTSFGSCSVNDPWEDLVELGLVADPGPEEEA